MARTIVARHLWRVSGWICVLSLALLPIVAAWLPNLTWNRVMLYDAAILGTAGVALALSSRARAGLKMLPARFRRPRPRRVGGLTAANFSL